MNLIPIVHCFDHNYVLQAAVCFYSLLEHASAQRRYAIEVVGRGLTQEDKALLTRVVEPFKQAEINFLEAPELDLPDFPTTNNLSKDVFYKLFAAELFPHYQQVVIADVDVIYQGDVAEVFDVLTDEDTALIAAPLDISYAAWRGEGILRDLGAPKSLERYKRKLRPEKWQQLRFGAGLMVHHLGRIREANLPHRWLAYTKKHFKELILLEQDVLNFVSGAQMKPLPGHAMAIAGYYEHYQALSLEARQDNPAWDEMFAHPIQIHYASGIKPWRYPTSPMADLWFDALQRSGLFALWLKWIDNDMHGAAKEVKKRDVFRWKLPFGKNQHLVFSLTKEKRQKKA